MSASLRNGSTWKEQFTTKCTKKHEGKQCLTRGLPDEEAHLAGDTHERENPLKNFVFFVSFVVQLPDLGSNTAQTAPLGAPRPGGRSAITPRHRQDGFSLLEVLVAFSILALTLGVLMQVFSQALGTTVLSGAYSRAAALAEARLDAVGVDIPLQPGTYSGEPEDGMEWQVAIAPYDLGQTGWQAPLQPYMVTATAGWEESGRRREVTLSTIRLGEPL